MGVCELCVDNWCVWELWIVGKCGDRYLLFRSIGILRIFGSVRIICGFLGCGDYFRGCEIGYRSVWGFFVKFGKFEDYLGAFGVRGECLDV